MRWPELGQFEGRAILAWPDRHVAEIDVPGMRTVTDANRVADALARARIPDDHHAVRFLGAPARLEMTYNRRLVTPMAIVSGIAATGHPVVEPAPGFDPADPPREGWRAIGELAGH